MNEEDAHELASEINDNWEVLRFYKREFVDVADFHRMAITCIYAAKAASKLAEEETE